MKFVAPAGQEIHVGLTSGHMALITDTPGDLDQMFHREAVALGAYPEGMAPAAADTKLAFDRPGVIRTTLLAMLDGKADEDFKADGTPNLTKLNAKLGFKASREEVDAAWAEVTADASQD